MGDEKMQMHRRAKRLEHRLRKQTDRAIGSMRRLRARARTFRERAVLSAVRGLGFASGFIQAIELSSERLRRTPPPPEPKKTRTLRAVPALGTEERHADERTIRRMAERQRGGISTEEMRERYDSGRHLGGLHGGAMPERLGGDEPRHVLDEPGDPKSRRPGHPRHMPAHRRGS